MLHHDVLQSSMYASVCRNWKQFEVFKCWYLWKKKNNFEYVLCYILCLDGPELSFRGAFSGLRQFSAAKNPLKMIKNTYFMSKVPFFLKIFKFLSWLFGHVAKQLEKKDKVNFKFYIVAAWLTKKFNTHITQYL